MFASDHLQKLHSSIARFSRQRRSHFDSKQSEVYFEENYQSKYLGYGED